MTIIDRHLLRTLFVPLAACLLGFTMLFVIWDLFDHLNKILDAGSPFLHIMAYYGLYIFPVLEYLAPASLLLATLYAMWQLTRSNELVAMRAGGIGFGRIMLPFLIVGLVFSLGSSAIKEMVTPIALKKTEQFKKNKYKWVEQKEVAHLAYYNSENRRMWVIDRMSPDNPALLHGVKLTEERSDGKRIRDLIADRAEYLDGNWWFYNLRIQYFAENDIPEKDPIPVIPGEGTVKELPYLTETPDRFF